MRPSDADIQARLSRTIRAWFPEEYARDFSAEERRTLAKSGAAMPDGSFPIVTTEDLKNAIHLARSPAQRAHVKKRAASLGASKAIPETWAHLSGQTFSAADADDGAILKAIERALEMQKGDNDSPSDAVVLTHLQRAKAAQEADIKEGE